MKSTLIFIPCYNCAPQVQRLLAALPSELSESADVLVVDNQSQDDLKSIYKNISPFSIRLFRNDVNYGLGGSFKNAFEAARQGGYKHFVLLHGDNQANPNDIPRLLALAKSNEDVAAVLGARFMRGSHRKNFPLRRLIANRVLNGVASILSRRNIPELGSGLCVFNIAKLPWDFVGRLPDHIAFDFQILLFLIQTNTKFIFEPIEWKSEDEVTTINEFKVACTLLGQMAEWRLNGGNSHFEKWPWIGARSWHPLN